MCGRIPSPKLAHFEARVWMSRCPWACCNSQSRLRGAFVGEVEWATKPCENEAPREAHFPIIIPWLGQGKAGVLVPKGSMGQIL